MCKSSHADKNNWSLKERPILDHHPKAQSEMQCFSYEMRHFSYEKWCFSYEIWHFSCEKCCAFHMKST